MTAQAVRSSRHCAKAACRVVFASAASASASLAFVSFSPSMSVRPRLVRNSPCTRKGSPVRVLVGRNRYSRESPPRADRSVLRQDPQGNATPRRSVLTFVLEAIGMETRRHRSGGTLQWTVPGPLLAFRRRRNRIWTSSNIMGRVEAGEQPVRRRAVSRSQAVRRCRRNVDSLRWFRKRSTRGARSSSLTSRLTSSSTVRWPEGDRRTKRVDAWSRREWSVPTLLSVRLEPTRARRRA